MRFMWCVLLSACLCVSAEVRAQEAINYGTISGRITDPQGAVVPGAVVTATQIETSQSRESVADGEGRFRFPYLRVGRYEIAVRMAGFNEVSRVIAVSAGSAFELPLALSIEGVNTSVTVSGEATVLESARTQISGTVPQREVESVPLNGRNFLDIALLVPGVSPTNTGSTQLFAETSAVPGQGISVASQRNFSNNFIVDGLSANDDAAGFSGIPYGVDAVEEFQVVTSGGQAELGRALGGYVNIVTKSGTNTFRGDLYGYFRDDSLNATNALLRESGGEKPPMSQSQYGATAGGPLVRGRTFYFTNVEQRRLDQTGLTTVSPENVGIINARLATIGYPGSPVTTGVYPNPVNTSYFLSKLDHQVNSRVQLGVRYSLYDAFAKNSRGAGGLNAPTASAGLDNLDQSVAFSSTTTLSSRTVNETRVQVAHGRLAAPPSDAIGPAVSIAGVAGFGTSSGSPHARVNTLYQAVSSVSHQAGSHAVRGGVDFLYNDDTITYPRSARGSYAFSSMANFLAGIYNTSGFTQTFAASTVEQTNPNLGLYVQDEWKVSPSVAVNAGLRYDLQFLETIETDANNVSPRIGFAWTAGRSRKTVVRGSAGLFFDRVPLRAVANALLSAGNTTDIGQLRQISISLSPTQAGAPVFPQILMAAVPSVTLPNLTTMDRDLQNAYSRQASVEVERLIGDTSTISVAYQYVRGSNLLLQINQNVPTCAAVGNNNGCRPNSSYANNNQYSSEARSNYHGLHVSFVQRPAAWGHYRISYALSKSMNNVGENFFSSPIDPFDLSKDWGRSDDDQRHRLVIAGTAVLPFGFDVSSSMQAYSALPLNITSGVTTLQGTAGRPIVGGEFIGRNTGSGSDYFALNARLRRAFRLRRGMTVETLAEVFNLTDRKNAISRNGNFGSGSYPGNPSPNFNQVLAVAEPRTVQLAVRLRF